MSTQELRFEPMSTGMILDRAFRLYAQNFALMIGISVLINIPVFLFSIFSITIRPAFDTISIVALVITFGGFLLSSMIVTPLANGAATRAVSDRYLGRPVTITQALKASWSKLWTLVLTQAVVGVIVIIGLTLLIVPGILWALSYMLIAPVAMIETSDRERIRKRSWELVKGNRGKVFVILFVIGVVGFLLGSASAFLFGLGFESGSLVGGIVSQTANLVMQTMVYPLQAIAITLLYYDFRIRKEGFDLEMLSQAVEKPAEPA